MIIEAKTIPHNHQRYNTVGDWLGNKLNRFITVSELGDPDMELCIAIHEIVEQALCIKRGISEESVANFDLAYKGYGEPGDEINAPYHREHTYATAIEMSLAKELGIDLQEYERRIEEVYKSRNVV